jgi:branched-chain amino acid transport system ATP-binding protein
MLELRGVAKSFGGLMAVYGLDLHVRNGEIVGLIGPNGAGKTTVFNLITGFLKPSRGKILFHDEDITGKSPHVLARKGIVRTFQGNLCFPEFTVLENLLVASNLTAPYLMASIFRVPSSRKKEKSIKERAFDLLEFVGLSNMAHLPARSLSHGHKRVLGIAMALASRPKVLLLDEPLSGMNAREVSETVELLRKIWERGITILLIEHNMRATMGLCERVVVLNFGKKIAEGAPEEIRENPEVMKAYLGERRDVPRD